MWFVHTIICIYNISIVPFCAYDGKLPIKFEDLKSCDIFIDDIIETINEDLIEKDLQTTFLKIHANKLQSLLIIEPEWLQSFGLFFVLKQSGLQPIAKKSTRKRQAYPPSTPQ